METPEQVAENIATQFVMDYEICLRPSKRAATKHPDPLSRRIADALRAAFTAGATAELERAKRYLQKLCWEPDDIKFFERWGRNTRPW